MKKLILIVACFFAVGAYGQNQRVAPIYFFSPELTSVDSFNSFLLAALPDFHLKSMDTTNKQGWDFSYTNNKVYENSEDILHISYSIIAIAGNRALQIPFRYGIGNVQITGEFLTLVKVYNKLFSTNMQPEELLKKCPLHGPIGYNGPVWNNNSYWFTMESASKGYWMFFRKL